MTFLCEICNKKYITNSGFWKHNNKYHNSIQNNTSLNITQKSSLITQKSSLNTQKSSLNKLECIYCNKILSRIDNLKRHEDKCKNKKNEIDKLRTQVTILEPLVQKYEIELFKNNSNQITNNNNQITTNNNNHITTNNTVNNNNNTVNNTINIVKFGGERLSEILTEEEMMKITKYINFSVNESIKSVHFNDKRPEFKNIRIKNLKGNHLQIHNGARGPGRASHPCGKKFITDKKYSNLYELIDNHIYNIHTFITNNQPLL